MVTNRSVMPLSGMSQLKTRYEICTLKSNLSINKLNISVHQPRMSAAKSNWMWELAQDALPR